MDLLANVNYQLSNMKSDLWVRAAKMKIGDDYEWV